MPSYSPATTTTLRRKSPPTCTLSLAHVSAASKFHSQPKTSFTVKNAELNLSTMQVELQVDFSSVITVPVQVHIGDSTSSTTSPSIRRSKSKKRIHLKKSEINVIPFPTSPPSPVSDSSSSSSQSSNSSNYYSSDSSATSTYSSSSNRSSPPSATHVLLRSSKPVQSPSTPAAKRARNGTVNASVSFSTSARSTLRTSPSSDASHHSASFSSSPTQTIAQLPPRPSSPTPHSPIRIPLQDKKQLVKNDECFDPPPYSSPPPPYSPSPDLRPLATDKTNTTTRPLSAPATASSPPKPSRLPTAKPSLIPLTQTQARRPRVSSSELKTILYLYRTIMYGVERRHRLETSQKQPFSETASPSTSPGRGSGNHFARFPLVEEDEDDDDQPIFAGPQRAARRLSKSPAQQAANFDVQDAFLAIRLRVFLKAQGVSEEELAIQFDADEDSYDEDFVDMKTNIVSQVDAASIPAIISPSPLPPHIVGGSDRPIRSSPPPLSPIPKVDRRSIPSAAYMIALLRMRNRQNPGQKLFAVVNDHGNANGSKPSGRGRLSGLRVCSWVAGDGDGEQAFEEVEEEFDCASVVDWYAGLDY